MREATGGAYAACEWTHDAAELVDLGERLCRHVGVDIIPRDKLFFTRDLADGTLAVTVAATARSRSSGCTMRSKRLPQAAANDSRVCPSRRRTWPRPPVH